MICIQLVYVVAALLIFTFYRVSGDVQGVGGHVCTYEEAGGCGENADGCDEESGGRKDAGG
uniref:Uncharacterized protein n=1 Tax=Phytophthora fragariae TaxID=53985 RepID=A0A6A3D9S6_9STRA|nr:hypothetical protein PF009_g31935 [Phytophthora fragariae]